MVDLVISLTILVFFYTYILFCLCLSNLIFAVLSSSVKHLCLNDATLSYSYKQ